MMSDGVRDGRIITTPPRYWDGSGAGDVPGVLPAPEESHFVYRRHGLDCRDCGTPVALTELGARKLYWCPACQQALSRATLCRRQGAAGMKKAPPKRGFFRPISGGDDGNRTRVISLED